jgi:hypothetical protein
MRLARTRHDEASTWTRAAHRRRTRADSEWRTEFGRGEPREGLADALEG